MLSSSRQLRTIDLEGVSNSASTVESIVNGKEQTAIKQLDLAPQLDRRHEAEAFKRIWQYMP
jgi:hypothetical protein